MRNMLLEMSPVDPATGLTTTIRLSWIKATSSGTLVDGKFWAPAINVEPEFSYSMWSEGQPQSLTVSYGSIGFAITADLANYAWSKLAFRGAVATLWEGDTTTDKLSDYRQLWQGTLGPFKRTDDRSGSFSLSGPEAVLTRDLLTNAYLGTGGAEGPADMIGQLKPWSWGKCTNVAPVWIDKINMIYQVDGYNSRSINAVYENALTLGVPKYAVTSYAELKALKLVPGEWAVAPNVAMFRIGAEPTGVITADIGSPSTVGDVTRALLKSAGLADNKIDASVLAMDRPYDCYVEEQTSILDLAHLAAYAGSRYLIADSSGKFFLAPYASTAAPISLSDKNTDPQYIFADSITQEVNSDPAWRVKVGHTHVYYKHSPSDVSPAVAELGADLRAAEEAAQTLTDFAEALAAESAYTLKRIQTIDDDGMLDRSEKQGLVTRFQTYTAERAGVYATAVGLGLAAIASAYALSYDNFSAYLSGLSPAYDDTGTDTPINGDLEAYEKAYLVARQDVANANAAAAAKLANWPSITGAGKPEDNATVGAPNGTQVGGVPVESVVDAIKDGNGVVKSTRQQIAEGNAILDVKIAAAKKAATDASAEAAQVRLDLVPTIASAKQSGLDATAAATKISTDLSAEVSRAKDVEDTLRTRIESAQGGADGAYSLIATETTQRKDADSALTQRVETIISAANTDRLAANTAITNEITARTNAIDTVGRRIDTIVSDYQGANGSTNTRIQTEELARASGDEALGRRATTLESRAGGAGNLLSNTDLSNLTGWTQTYGSAGLYLNAAGSTWQLGNIENNISFHDVNPNASVYSQVTSDAFAVEGGTFIQFYALAAAHRSRAWVTLFFYDKTGALSDYAGENYGVREGAGGAEINQQDQIGVKSYRVPNTAVAARMALRIYPTMPANDPYTWFARPYAGIAREGQTEWTPYSPGSAKVVLNSTNAAIRDEQDTRASQTLALAIRSNTLEAQFRGEQASYINTRIANEEIARSTAVEAIAVRSNILESQFRGDTDSPILARIRNEETTRSTADTAIANRATSLEARSTGAGNLITNTDFVTTTGWTPSTNLTGVTHVINAAGDGYHPPGENVLSIFQGPYNGLGSGGYADWFSTRFAVAPNSFIQVYAFLNCHRCQVEFYIAWIDSNGGIFNYAQKPMIGPTNQGGTNINDYARFGWSSIQVPSNAVAAAVVFRKYDTFYGGDPNSYAWCLRPYVGGAREGQTEWNAYAPGSGKAALIEATARISSEETTRSNADGALGQRIDNVNAAYRADVANLGTDINRVNQEVINTNAQVSSVNQASANRDAALGSRVDSVVATYNQANTDRYNQTVAVDARVTSEANASANRDGALGSRIDSVTATANNATSSASVALAAAQDAQTKLGQARVTLTADAGNGRAQLSLYSDSYGNTGVDIVGNTRFKGILDIDGATGSGRMKITNQLIEVYDANNVARIRLGFW